MGTFSKTYFGFTLNASGNPSEDISLSSLLCSLNASGTEGTTGNLSENCIFPAHKIRSGGIVSLNATLAISLNFTAQPLNNGLFVNDAQVAILSISGFTGTIGTYQNTHPPYAIAISGYEGTTGTLSVDAILNVINASEFQTAYDCMVICTDNVANTIYNNFNFQSITEHKGTVFAAAADGSGIYSLGADNDNGSDIAAIFELAPYDGRSSRLKRVPSMTVGMRGGALTVQLFQDNTYSSAETLTSTGSEMRNRRAKFGRGKNNRYWGAKFQNVSGSDFDIDSIELHDIKGSRRLVE